MFKISKEFLIALGISLILIFPLAFAVPDVSHTPDEISFTGFSGEFGTGGQGAFFAKALDIDGNANFSGKVGIGTTTPGQRLSVKGIIESTADGFKFPDGTVQTSAATSSIGNNINGDLIVSGKVGIGVSDVASSVKLYVAGGSNNYGIFGTTTKTDGIAISGYADDNDERGGLFRYKTGSIDNFCYIGRKNYALQCNGFSKIIGNAEVTGTLVVGGEIDGALTVSDVFDCDILAADVGDVKECISSYLTSSWKVCFLTKSGNHGSEAGWFVCEVTTQSDKWSLTATGKPYGRCSMKCIK